MLLINVYDEPKAVPLLYQLLSERQPEANISHTKMPTMPEHEAFIASRPYHAWYMIKAGDDLVGAIYLGKDGEIGIGIFEKYQGKHLGTKAIKLIMEKHEGPFLANIAPHNGRSMHLFEKLGFRLIQYTYADR